MKGKKHHGKHAKGGGIMEAGGNPNVLKEGHQDKEGEVSERKHGGKAKHHRKAGGAVEGHKMKHRMDRHHRPGRKRGGGVGADTTPLSTAHHDSANPGKTPATQQGGMSK